MRDPKRLKPFLELLAQAWRAYPDLRIGQLLEWALSRAREDSPYDGPDLFQAEEFLLEAGLRSILRRGDEP